MSDFSQGPGWWLASDGRWYPPETHPDHPLSHPPRRDEPEATLRHEQGEVPASRWVGTTPAAEPTVPWTPGGTGRAKAVLVVAAVVALGLAVAALVVAFESGSGGTGPIPDGPATATIEVTVSGGGPPSFSGTVAGRALTGVVSGAASIGAGPGLGFGGEQFTYTGNLGAEPFVIHVGLSPSGLNSGGSLGRQLLFSVTGTYGSQPVSGTAGFNLSSVTSSSVTVSVRGRIGSRDLDGEATATMGTGHSVQVTANLNVVSAR